MTMLSPYRVLDLTTERGLLCGQMLGDLGADVIKVEPPGGSPARMIPPFVGDEPHRDRSLYWWAYNRNKRSITVDLEHPDGREIVFDLVRRADFLIESFNPGYMDSLGLDYAALGGLNPKLIYVSITPFGQDGPKASYADSDLIVMAAGGPQVLTGDDDRPPVRLSVPQGYLHASGDAAVGAMLAHHERVRSGPRAARRYRGPGVGRDGDSIDDPGCAAQFDSAHPFVGRGEAGPGQAALRVAGQGRIRDAEFSVRLGAGRLHPQADALYLQAGFLR